LNLDQFQLICIIEIITDLKQNLSQKGKSKLKHVPLWIKSNLKRLWTILYFWSSWSLVPNVVIDEEEDQPQNLENDVPNQENLRRSQRVRKLVIRDDYDIFASEEIHIEGDPTSYEEAMRSPHSFKWGEAMENEMRSKSANQVWKLKEIPKTAKTVGCKWVYKIMRDSKGNIDWFKTRLMAKGFTQREGIDYNEIISSVSSKDSFIIIMTLVVHYDLKLYQMDVKTAFLNGNLYENVYMAQPKGFIVEGKENLRCHLTKSIYGLKQAFSQWYLKFDETIRKFGFKKWGR
jgi:hypothetical protein